MSKTRTLLPLYLVVLSTFTTPTFADDENDKKEGLVEIAAENKKESAEAEKKADDAVKAAENKKEIVDAISGARKISTGDPATDKILSAYLEQVQRIVTSTRALQGVVFAEAVLIAEQAIAFLDSDEFKSLDKPLQDKYTDFLLGDKDNDGKYKDNDGKYKGNGFLDKMKSMIVTSSDDYTFDNPNQSGNMAVRLAELKNMLNHIQGSTNTNSLAYRISLAEELTYDTESDFKFLRRFKAGLGISYSYLPEIRYSGFVSPDLTRYLAISDVDADGTPFNGVPIDRPSAGRFEQDFSNTSYPSLTFSAHMQFLSATIAFPIGNETRSISARDTEYVLADDEQRLVAKHSISTDFEPQFQAFINTSIPDLWYFLKDEGLVWWVPYLGREGRTTGRKLSQQIDFGLQFGMTSFKLTDTYSSDVRLVGQGTSFENAESLGTITGTNKHNLRPISTGFYLRLEPSDSMTLGFDVRFYHDDDDGGYSVEVDGATASVNFTWIFL